MSTNLTQVEQLAVKLNNDVNEVSKELKRVQSVKCRLKKQKGKKSYEKEMTEVLKYEQLLKEAKQLLEPKDKTVPEYEQEDVDRLDYDETIKAIKSIQSKKTLSKWLTTIENDNDEYRKACKIEQMLLEHKKKVQPIDQEHVRKTNVNTIIETLESNKDLSNESVIELLKKLL
jgi:hypothetical protein